MNQSDGNGPVGRQPDELDEVLDFPWNAFEKWKKESGTRANDSSRLSEAVVSLATDKKFAKKHDHFLKVKIGLSVGDDKREYCDFLGFRYTRNRVIEKIAEKIGKEKWSYYSQLFLQLPSDYEHRIRRPREILKSKTSISKQCRILAGLIEKSGIDDLVDTLNSPFSGLLAKQVFTIEWFWALQALRHACSTPKEAAEIVRRCFWGLYLTPASRSLSRMLHGYAEALDSWRPDRHHTALLTFASGKLNEKEFIKRVVFSILNSELNRDKRKNGSPNLETATVVNIILGLSGKRAVKPNDITQMNRKGRTKYYKEADSYVTWRKQ